MSDPCREVEQVLAHYTAYGDAGMVGEFAALFADDGVLRVAGHDFHGPPGVRAFVGEQGRRMVEAGGLLPGFHHVGSRLVEVDGDLATASSVFAFFAPHGIDHWGTYRDRLERRSDGWRFRERSVRFSGFASGSTARAIVSELTAPAS
jgi:hypothetical protein